MVERKQVFVLLDGLRGLAAFSVVQMHIGDQYGLIYSLRHAYLAVPFFFMLSGIVIAHAYENGIMRNAPARSFARVRIERLYPLLLIALLIDVFVRLAQSRFESFPSGIELLAALLLIPAKSIPIFPLNPPQWSLAVEIWGNMAHRLTLRWLSDKVLIAVIAVGFLTMSALSFHHGGLNVGFSLSTLLAGVSAFIFSYATGIFIYRLRLRGRLDFSRCPVWVPVILLSIALAVPQKADTPWNAARDIICAAIIFPTVLILAMNIKVTGYFGQLCTWLGALSYPVYIVHYPIVAGLAGWWRDSGASRIMQYASVPVLMLIVISISWLCLMADVRIRAKIRAMRGRRSVEQRFSAQG